MAAEDDSSLLTPSAAPVTVQPVPEKKKTTMEPTAPTESTKPTGAAEPTAPMNRPMGEIKAAERTSPADDPILTSVDAVTPDYDPEEILYQTGGVMIPWGDSIFVDYENRLSGKVNTVIMQKGVWNPTRIPCAFFA